MVGVIGKLKCTSYSLIFYERRWVEVKLMIMDNNVKLWERKKEGKNKYVLLFKQTSCPFFFPGLIDWFEKVGTTTNYKLYSNNKASLKTIYHIILLVDPCIAQFLSNSIQIGLIQSIQSILIHLIKFNLFRLLGPLGLVWSITVSISDHWV